ncbi:microfibril-associated glycoprotein 4-like [Menidia menidia]
MFDLNFCFRGVLQFNRDPICTTGMMKLPAVLLLLALMMVSCGAVQTPADCSHIHQQNKKSPSGVYTIYPIGSTSAVQVYCDMDSHGGRWTVFQRRMDGSVNFYRAWDQYRAGLEASCCSVEGNAASDLVPAGDGLQRHNGQKFSTFDKDQDIHKANCAKSYLGGFWYDNCHSANPNGVYRRGKDGTLFAVGVEWKPWRGHNYSLKAISMKIRPVH